MTNPQQPGGDYLAPTATVLGLAAVGPGQYTAAQATISAHLVALAVRVMRKFGIPLSDQARRQMARRMYGPVQQARVTSYALAVRSMEYAARAADEPLPTLAPIAPYTPDALEVLLQDATAPLLKAIQAEAAGAHPSPVTILDRRTGMPIPIRDQDHDPGSGRVIYRIGETAGAAAARHAHHAGREAVQRTADRSGEEIGWARVTTSAKPCAFCIMLASRGPVYRSEKTAVYRKSDMGAYHNHCQCRAVLVYRGKAWAGQSAFEDADRLWRTATAGHRGPAALAALRRTLAAQTRNALAA